MGCEQNEDHTVGLGKESEVTTLTEPLSTTPSTCLKPVLGSVRVLRVRAGPARIERIPTLGNAMLVALAMLLLWLAGLTMRGQGVPRCREPKAMDE